jgi:hypothetical protein
MAPGSTEAAYRHLLLLVSRAIGRKYLSCVLTSFDQSQGHGGAVRSGWALRPGVRSRRQSQPDGEEQNNRS